MPYPVTQVLLKEIKQLQDTLKETRELIEAAYEETDVDFCGIRYNLNSALEKIDSALEKSYKVDE